jgi:hypothetical protein
VTRYLWLVAGLLLGQVTPVASVGLLGSEMARLNVREALIVASEAVDYAPVWSPKGDFLAANVEGRWSKVDLSRIRLEPGRWHDQPIGVMSSKSSVSDVSEKEVKAWSRRGRPSQRVRAKNGTVVELRAEGLGTSLTVTRKGGLPERLWTSGLETCHSLVLSPGEQFVAFIAELNGVVVERL